MSTDNPGGGDARPAFVTSTECQEWLAAAPLTNPIQAQAQFLHQLNLLNRREVPASERWGILERLRKPVLFAQREAAKRFTAKALPLVPPEQAAFDTCQALWQALHQGYLRCLENYPESGSKATVALFLERAIVSLVEAQVDTYLAGFEPAASHWRTLHGLYSRGEQLGIASQEIEDRPHMGRSPGSVATAYAEALLLHAASPHELPLRHLVWISRWSRRWAGKIAFLPALPLESRGQPLCVDLAGTGPATYRPLTGAGVRWLDSSQLRQSLKKRLNLLQQGTAPADLQLGEDCSQPACGRLLRQAYQRWCKGGEVRGHERQAVDGKCELIAGIDAIHYYVSGRTPFRQPGYANDSVIRREREEIATFGRVANRRQEHFSEQQGYQMEDWQVVEEWQMVDESAQGVHAVHGTGRGSTRISQGQLVAVRPQNAQQLLLGSTRWAMVTADGNLHVGILVVPGRPEAVAVRSTGLAAVKEGYRQGFLLPGIGSLGTAANIVIPSGWFKKERVIEVYTDHSRQLRLVELLDRGVDFDRATYEIVT
jgi:hypothetical protein